MDVVERRRHIALIVATAVAVALTVAYVLVPEGVAGQLLYLVAQSAAVVAIVVSTWRLPAAARGTWWWIAGGVLFEMLGDLGWAIYGWVGTDLPDTMWVDFAYLISYAALGVGLFRIVRARSHRFDREPLLDAAAAAVLGLLLVWQFIVSPSLDDGATPLLARLVALSYPVADVVLLSLLVWIRSVGGRRDRSIALLMVGLVCWTAADLAFSVLNQTGAYSFGATRAIDAGWMLGTMVIGLAALRDRDGVVADGTSRDGLTVRSRRLMFGVVLVLVPPSVEFMADLVGGERVPVEVMAASILVAAIVCARSHGLIRARDQVEDELAANRHYFMALAAHSSDAVLVMDRDGTIRNESPSAAALVGLAGRSTIGLSALDHVHPADRGTVQALFREAWVQPGSVLTTELRLLRADGSHRWVAGRIVDLLADPDVAGMIVNLHDIDARKIADEQLHHLAFHDPLTDLANRALFRDRVSHALARTQRTGVDAAVLFLDLDSFKVVNDSLGHDAGDTLLREVAVRLLDAVRASDTVARLGGDEFAVLVEDVHSVAEPEVLAERLLGALAAPVDLDGQQVAIGASIGIALADAHGDAASLLRNADIAMYRAKADGKGRWVVFDVGMEQAARDRLRLENDLAHALERRQFRIEYQPVVELTSNRVTGFEALLRWTHPELGAIGPDRFIPVAEETGLIVPIGRWVLREAAATAARWQREFPLDPSLTMAVNLSARQLTSPDLVADVAETLAVTGLAPSSLVLEMTETTLVANPEEAARRLHDLRALGIRLAIDDFGTGYSSLSYLRQFPVDVLKIDRSFVQTIAEFQPVPALLRGLLDLGRTLQLELVAEGIELDHQLAQLRHADCHLGQGFLFARPLSEVDAEALLIGLIAGHADQLTSAPTPTEGHPSAGRVGGAPDRP
jgi:diguanylate cyclase (GGDEF)-like protein/PAS domain S-box-containing protein